MWIDYTPDDTFKEFHDDIVGCLCRACMCLATAALIGAISFIMCWIYK